MKIRIENLYFGNKYNDLFPGYVRGIVLCAFVVFFTNSFTSNVCHFLILLRPNGKNAEKSTPVCKHGKSEQSLVDFAFVAHSIKPKLAKTMTSTNDFLFSLESMWLAMNSATVSILQCRYDDALDTLTEVFQNEAVLEAWKHRDPGTSRDDDKSDNTLFFASSPSTSRRLLSVTPLPAFPLRQTDGSFLNPFSIDHHGILFQDEAESRRVLLGMCAVSLFNMAVAYHSMALRNLDSKQSSRDTSNCEDLLRQARSLYLQSNLLLKRVNTTLDPKETLTNVYLAICNNMIVVESHLGNANESWRKELSQSFCLIPARVGCPVYQHFEAVLTRCIRTGA